MDQVPHVAIIGAGFGGLAMAIALKTQLGFNNFTIYEKASDIGGTWRDNVYPGCSSDNPIHLYCLSTDLRPTWTNTHGYQPEIFAYMKSLVDKYSLQYNLSLNTKFLSAHWDSEKQLYRITTEDTVSGKKNTATAQIIISAIGILEMPKMPEIAGIDRFKGFLFHSSRWNTKLDLQGKRVAVIGNGSSASQFIPEIVQLREIDVTQFCRSRIWYLPPIRQPISVGIRRIFERYPFLMRLYRIFLYLNVLLQTELNYALIFGSKTLREHTTEKVRKYMVQKLPKKYYNDMIPEYPLGCKRMVFNSGYIEALHRQNLRINRDTISSIVEDGIETGNGEKHLFDVIICATGFIADKFPVDIRGCKGTSIQEYYESQGGPKAHLGTTIPGFPNFYMLSGPNTATGYSPVLLFEEIQVKYILQMIQPVLQSRVSSFEVTVKATEAYNHKIQRMMLRSAFVNCVSPYRIAGDGKITFVFPGSTVHFWWWLRRPIWDDYISVCSSSDSGADTDESASPSLVKVMAGSGVLAVAVAWAYRLL